MMQGIVILHDPGRIHGKGVHYSTEPHPTSAAVCTGHFLPRWKRPELEADFISPCLFQGMKAWSYTLLTN
jgi:hypothetical protein